MPIRTFNDWHDPPPGFCEVDMVAHGGTSVAGSFIQTLTMVDVATGWTECMPLLTRESGLVVRAIAPEGSDECGAASTEVHRESLLQNT